MTAHFPRLPWFRRLARKSLAPIFYRLFYLREDALSKTISGVVPVPQQPDKDLWDSEYNKGYWEKLYDLSEQGHYALLLSYVLRRGPAPSVLDIGCGEGIFLNWLAPHGYKHYTGIDFSETVIAKCAPRCDTKTSFLSANAEEYEPDRRFDAIVFCESIYYFRDPINTVVRYGTYLNENGVFVITLHRHLRTEAIRSRLKDRLELIHETTITNTGGTWFCLLAKPREHSPAS